jgi:hypothetical protein
MRVRIVPEKGFREDALYPLLVAHDWSIKRRIAQDGDQPREYIYGTEDANTNIHFIMDHKIGVDYLLVSGPDAQRIANTLRSKLFHYHSEEIVDRAREPNLSPADRRRALYHLALDKMDHGFDQESFDIYCTAMRDADPFVRASAVLGAAYLGWPELADPLRPLATSAEPDELIRRDAATLVQRLDVA